MSIDEDYNNHNKLDTIETPIDLKKRVFQRSKYSYEYFDLIENILRLRVEFFIKKERLAIIEQILELKNHNHFPDFIEQAIIEKVERDLNSPATIAEDFCKTLLKRWDMNPESPKRKSLQYPVNE